MTTTLNTDYKFILIDEDQVPFIKGTSMKVGLSGNDGYK